MTPEPSGTHLATVAHGGRIWDAYVELVNDPHRTDIFRAMLRFDSPDGGDANGTYRTGMILIESSYEAVIAKARAFDDRQLVNLLRSVLPDEEDDETVAEG